MMPGKNFRGLLILLWVAGMPGLFLEASGEAMAVANQRPNAGQAAVAGGKRPNIIFILSDDHRWDALGAAGNRSIRTPVLDRLAREGVYFRQATINVPQCTPSRATLLTGLPPHQHGYYSNQFQRPDVRTRDGFRGVPTLPGLLRQASYRTVLVGKWHLFPDPWNCGFSDVRIWMPAGGGPYQNPPLARGQSRETQTVTGFTNEIFADEAVSFLKSDAAREQPFFLWLALTAPHLPMQPTPERIRALYAGRTSEELAPTGFSPDKPTLGGTWLNYYESVSHLDEQVGRVLAVLRERQLEANTFVAFMGDNGYMMGSRGRNGKVVPWEESIRVPMILRAPTPAVLQGRSDAPVSSLDLPPTFLALAGVKPPASWVGRELAPLMRGDKEHVITESVSEWADNQSPQFGTLGYRVFRTATHKLIIWERPEHSDELYDLTIDPRETRNLIKDPSAHSLHKDLLARLRTWMEKTKDPAREWRQERRGKSEER